MAAPHGWTSKGQERGAMVLKSSAPQAKSIKLEKRNDELLKTVGQQQEKLDSLMAMLKDRGIVQDE